MIVREVHESLPVVLDQIVFAGVNVMADAAVMTTRLSMVVFWSAWLTSSVGWIETPQATAER